MAIGKRFMLVAALATAGLGLSEVDAAIPTFSQTQYDIVTLDGVQIGGGLAAANGGSNTQLNTVWYENGSYHMWLRTATAREVPNYRYATSANGIDFTSVGNLTFDSASPWNVYIEPDQAASPTYDVPKIAKVGDDYHLLFWSHGLNTSPYTYTISANNIGPMVNDLVVSHLGPVANGAPGNASISSLVPMGVVNGVLYGLQDGSPTNDFAMARGPGYEAGPQVSVDSYTVVKNGLTTLAGYTPGVHSTEIAEASVLELMEEGHLLALYTISTNTPYTRTAKEIFAMESWDDGLTWTDPVGLFGAAANTFTAEGPITLTGGFRHPEMVVLDDATARVYFSSTWLDGSTSRTFFLTGVSNVLPEPASLGLLAAGAGLLAFRRRSAR